MAYQLLRNISAIWTILLVAGFLGVDTQASEGAHFFLADTAALLDSYSNFIFLRHSLPAAGNRPYCFNMCVQKECVFVGLPANFSKESVCWLAYSPYDKDLPQTDLSTLAKEQQALFFFPEWYSEKFSFDFAASSSNQK